VLIPRNTTTPAKMTEPFTTTTNNQTEILFRVFEGERPLTAGNNLLGQFELKGIPPAPREVPKIDVTFSLDANGILCVQAVDAATKQSAQIVITHNQGRLSKDDIERMLRDEERFREADAAEQARLDLHAQLESLAHRAKTFAGSAESGVPQDEAARVAMGAEETLAWLRRSSEAPRSQLEGEMDRLTALLRSANIALKDDDEGAEGGGGGGAGRRRTNIEDID
jgi:molecular chaperone DnaK (HSP70)